MVNYFLGKETANLPLGGGEFYLRPGRLKAEHQTKPLGGTTPHSWSVKKDGETIMEC